MSDLLQNPARPACRARRACASPTRAADARVYRNENALPRVFLVERQRTVADDDAALAAVTGARLRRAAAWRSPSARSPGLPQAGDAARARSGAGAGSGAARLVRYEDERVVARVSGAAPQPARPDRRALPGLEGDGRRPRGARRARRLPPARRRRAGRRAHASSCATSRRAGASAGSSASRRSPRRAGGRPCGAPCAARAPLTAHGASWPGCAASRRSRRRCVYAVLTLLFLGAGAAARQDAVELGHACGSTRRSSRSSRPSSSARPTPSWATRPSSSSSSCTTRRAPSPTSRCGTRYIVVGPALPGQLAVGGVRALQPARLRAAVLDRPGLDRRAQAVGRRLRHLPARPRAGHALRAARCWPGSSSRST